MTTITAGDTQLDIGRVVELLVSVLKRNLVTFGMLALILTGLPALVVHLLAPRTVVSFEATSGAWLFTSTLIAVVTGLVLQGTLIYATIGDLTGRRIGVVEGLTVGTHSLLPLLAVGLLYGLAVALGCVLLVVPGIMIAVAWAVAVPVLIAERCKVADTFARSAELTRGNRWRIFGLGLLFVLAMIVLEVAASIVGGVAEVTSALAAGALPVQHALIETATSVISALVGATGGAALYVELRRIRDDVGPEDLAAIFD